MFRKSGNTLKIIERMRLSTQRKKRLNELKGTIKYPLLKWSRSVTLLNYCEHVKTQLHNMSYDPVYSCYTGIDWKTGRRIDALSELVAGGGSNPEPAAPAAAVPAISGDCTKFPVRQSQISASHHRPHRKIADDAGAGSGGGGRCVLARAGSGVLTSQAIPRMQEPEL